MSGGRGCGAYWPGGVRTGLWMLVWVFGGMGATSAPAGSGPTFDEEGNLLIIAHDPWLAEVQPLAAHKQDLGINTTVVGVSTIGNNPISIKAFIQSVYDSSDLAFVLLVGDFEHVASPYVGDGLGDPTYAQLAGTDPYPDILVGRFCARSSLDVVTQVERTIQYETAPATTQPWFWRGAGVGADTALLDSIRSQLLVYGYTEIDRLYDPAVTPAQINAALNTGRGIVNYAGHGGSSGWMPCGYTADDIATLTNTGMLPVIFSMASRNGEFDLVTCFAEAWLRSTSGGVPIGAAAAYMSSVNLYWTESTAAHQAFVDLYTAEAYRTFGGLCFAATSQVMADYGPTGQQQFETWILFGDPSLRVVGVPAGGRIWHVDDDAPLGGTGRSWATPFRYLQDALAVAGDGDEVRVAAGKYRPDQDEGGLVTPGDPYAAFELANGVRLAGGYAGYGATTPDARDIELNESGLSGDLNGDDDPLFFPSGPMFADNSLRVVKATTVDETAVLDGFTITGGVADELPMEGSGGGLYSLGGDPTLQDCTFEFNWAAMGGGMYCDGGEPELTDCVFENNASEYEGGGLYCFGSNARLIRCTFSQNRSAQGGGVLCAHSEPEFEDCVFRGNRAEAAITGNGGAIWNWDGRPTLIRCVLNSNEANVRGGAIYYDYASGGELTDCELAGNEAEYGGGIYGEASAGVTLVNCMLARNAAEIDGGAIYDFSSTSGLTLHNCLLTGNAAGNDAGAVFIDLADLTVNNCTLFDNSAGSRGGGLYLYVGVGAEVVNSILWANHDIDGRTEPAQIHTNPSNSLTVNYTCLEAWTGDYGGAGNFDDDPRFVPGPAGNFYLSQMAAGNVHESPAVDAGDPAMTPPASTTRCDEQADAGVIDLGCHYPVTGDTLVMGDADRSGGVDLNDHAAFTDCLTGPVKVEVPPACRIFDFAEDADVDLQDFGALQRTFGG